MEAPGVHWLELVRTIISAGTLATVVLAYKSYSANLTKQNEDRERERDKELLAQAQKSFQWAYDALTDEGRSLPPAPDRLKWLTSARHLLRAKNLAKELAGSTYRTVYEETEEFWRLQFYLALDFPELHDWKYFGQREKRFAPSPVEGSSALVVLHFSTWKKGTPDPTDDIDREALTADLRNVFGARGLLEYLDQKEGAALVAKRGD